MSLSNRENFWPQLAAGIQEKPFIGHGLGESADFVGVVTDGRQENPHNDFLRVGFDVGLLGLGGFLLSIFLLMRRQRPRRIDTPYMRASFAQLAALPILMAFTNGLTYLGVSLPIFVLAGLALGHRTSVEVGTRALPASLRGS